MFFDDFLNFLENTLQVVDELYIFGDLNIHLDKPIVNARSFLDILDIFSLHHHVTFPTHLCALVRLVHHPIELQTCKSGIFL